LGFEATLRAAADKQGNRRDVAEYRRVVLGLIFLKYISDAFEEIRKNDYVLTPGRYVGAEAAEGDGKPAEIRAN
jgi:type I restriction enzyme M protein